MVLAFKLRGLLDLRPLQNIKIRKIDKQNSNLVDCTLRLGLIRRVFNRWRYLCGKKLQILLDDTVPVAIRSKVFPENLWMDLKQTLEAPLQDCVKFKEVPAVYQLF